MADPTKGPEGPVDPHAKSAGDGGQAHAAAAESDRPAKEAGAAAPAVDAAQSEMDMLKAENAELRDRMLRFAAELENLRKRTEREKHDLAKYAISGFARDIVGIGDNIQRAIDAVPADAAEKDATLKSYRDGVEATERELVAILGRHGIRRVAPKGAPFDPNYHQAMAEVTNPSVPTGTVSEVYQPGWMIEDRVLRPALVVVARGGPKAPKPGGETDNASATAPSDGRKAANDAGLNAEEDRTGAEPDTARPTGTSGGSG